MITSIKERSYMLRMKKDALLLMYELEENVEHQADIMERIERVEDELEKITSEHG